MARRLDPAEPPSGFPAPSEGLSLNEWYLRKAAAARKADGGPELGNGQVFATDSQHSLRGGRSDDRGHSHSMPIMPVFRGSPVVEDADFESRGKGGFVQRFTSMVHSAAPAEAASAAPLVTFLPNAVTILAPTSGGVGVRVLLEQPGLGASQTIAPSSRDVPPVGGSGEGNGGASLASRAPPIPAAMREAFMEAKRRMAKLKEEGKPLAAAAATSLGALGAYLVVPPGASKPDKVKKLSHDRKVIGASERLYPGPKQEEPDPEPEEPVLRVRGASDRLYPGPKPKAEEESSQEQQQSGQVKRVKGVSERLYPGPGGKPQESSNVGDLMDSQPTVSLPPRRVIGASSRLYPGPRQSRRRQNESSETSGSSDDSGTDDPVPAPDSGEAAPASPTRSVSPITDRSDREVEVSTAHSAPVRPSRADRLRTNVAQTRGSRRQLAVSGIGNDAGEAENSTHPSEPPSGGESLEKPTDSGAPPPSATVSTAASNKPSSLATQGSGKAPPKVTVSGKNGAYVNGKFVLFDPAAEARKKPSAAVCMKNLKKRLPGVDLREGGRTVGQHWMYRGCPGICNPAASSFLTSDAPEGSFIPTVDWSQETSLSNTAMGWGVKYMEWLDRFTHEPDTTPFIAFQKEVEASQEVPESENGPSDVVNALFMLDPPRGISLPPGSTTSALCIASNGRIIVGTVEGFVYVLGVSGELEGLLASKHGHVTQVACNTVWNSVVTAEKTGDGSGRHDCHMLHMYPLDGRAAVKPAGLTLSSNCVALCVCPVTGRVLVLLANGILIVVNPRADDFELVLEAEIPGRVITHAALFERYLCVGTEKTVRIVKLHRSPVAACDEESMCDADCLVSSCDVMLDGTGRMFGGNTHATAAAFPSVTQTNVQASSSFSKHFTCVTTESPIMDVGVTISYNMSAGYGCPMAHYGIPVIATAEFEPAESLRHIELLPNDSASVCCVVATTRRCFRVLIQHCGMNGLEHAKVSMVQHHRWASDVIQAIAVEPGMTFGWTDCGYVEVWSAWLPDETEDVSTISRFHVEVSKRLNGDVQSSLISMLDLHSSLTSHSHGFPVDCSFRLAMCGSHLVLWHSRGNAAQLRMDHDVMRDDDDFDVDGRFWLFPRRQLSTVLDEHTAACSATYLSETDSTSSKSTVILSLSDPRDCVAHQLSSLLHLWRLSSSVASALWSGIQARQSSSTDSRASIALLNEAVTLACTRLSCWHAMQTFAAIAGRCNKMVPRSICDVKLWSWEEFAYFAWQGVPLSVLFPPDCARALDSVDVLGHILQVLISTIVSHEPSSDFDSVSDFLSVVGGLASNSVKLPQWITALLSSVVSTSAMVDATRNALQAVTEFLTVLPLEALQWAVDIACDGMPAPCRASVSRVVLHGTSTDEPCCSSATICPTCIIASTLTAQSNWRRNCIEAASRCFLIRRSCWFPVVTVEILKTAKRCGVEEVSIWKSTLSVIRTELGVAEAEGNQGCVVACREAILSGLSFLVSHTDCSGLASLCCGLGESADVASIVAVAVKRSLGLEAAQATLNDLEALLEEDPEK